MVNFDNFTFILINFFAIIMIPVTNVLIKIQFDYDLDQLQSPSQFNRPSLAKSTSLYVGLGFCWNYFWESSKNGFEI